MNRRISIFGAAIALATSCAIAAPPGIINHQGRIAVGGVNFDGTGHFKFALVNATGTASLWSNDGTSSGGGEPTASLGLTVSKGHYAVALGESGAIPADVFADNDDVRLRVWFSQTGGAGTFEQLAPDRRLTSSPFALHSAIADGVSAGGVTAAMLAVGSVTSEKIASAAIGADQLAAGAAAANIDATGSLGIGLGGSDPAAAVHLDGEAPLLSPVLLSALNSATGYPDLEGARSVHVSGTTAFVASRTSDSLTIIDVTSPTTPVLLATLKDGLGGFDELDGANFVFVSGTTAFVTSYFDAALSIIDVTDPSAPVLLSVVKDGVGGFNELDGANSVRVLGTTAFVTSLTDDSLTIIDVSSPSAPMLLAELKDGVGGFDELGGAVSTSVVGNTLYVAAFTNDSLSIIDVTVPSAPVLLGVLKDGVGGFDQLNAASSVTVSGTTAYVTSLGEDALTIIDVAIPSAPVLLAELKDGVGEFNQLDGARTAHVVGTTAYVASFNDGSLTIIDVTNPSTPVLLAELSDEVAGFDQLFGANSVQVSGTTIYIAAFNDDSLTILDPGQLVGVDLATANRVGIGTARPGAMLHVEGDAVITGNLLDSASGTGASGQVLSATGTGTDWVTLLDNNATNELQSLSLAGDDLTLSDGNTIGLGRYLRSDISDSYTDGTLTFEPSTILRVNGTLMVGSEFGDDDSIYFNHSTLESLSWENADTAFRLTDALRLEGPLNAGNPSPQTRNYNYFSNTDPTPSTPLIGSGGDLFVQRNLEIGDRLFLSGRILMDFEDGDQSIFFSDDGAFESFSWIDSFHRFELSDDLALAGTLKIGAAGEVSQFYNQIGNSSSSHGLNANNDLHVSDDLEVEGTVFADGAVQVGDDLAVAGALQAGSATAAVSYNRMGTTTTSHSLGDASDLLVGDDVEVEGTVFADGDVEVGARLYLAGQIRMNTADGDQAIYFHDDGAQTNERILWDDSADRFYFSNDVHVDGVLTDTSDREKKEDFQPVDAPDLLEKVAALPLTTWQFRDDQQQTRHLGPTAQDFHAAFGLGIDDKRIARVDANGVALAAIQALKAENDAKSKEIAELRARLSAIEKLLNPPPNPQR